MKHKLLTAAVLLSCGISLQAEAGWWADSYNFLKSDIVDIWNQHNYDLYVPFYAWHNRLTYDREHIDRYNEHPWGAGLGFSHVNDEGTWSGLYALGFKDSNSYLETYFGYARQWNWAAGADNQWHAGIGYTLGLTQRHDRCRCRWSEPDIAIWKYTVHIFRGLKTMETCSLCLHV